jgi:hypothetical protein
MHSYGMMLEPGGEKSGDVVLHYDDYRSSEIEMRED